MKNPHRNQRIRLTHSTRGYEAGKVYTVNQVDPDDSTLTATDPNGKDGQWVPWALCMEAGPEISWDWLRGQLPGEVLELLCAFEGLEQLRLRDEIRDHILNQLPNLKQRILDAQVAIDDQIVASMEAAENALDSELLAPGRLPR
jgi:hypothetical protein